MAEVFEPIDCEALATCLAEEAWKEETKNVSTDDLYEKNKEVKPHWAYKFFNLRDCYLHLINYYKKKTHELV